MKNSVNALIPYVTGSAKTDLITHDSKFIFHYEHNAIVHVKTIKLNVPNKLHLSDLLSDGCFSVAQWQSV